MKTDRWVHILGTASGQWDIFYGVIWGTRTAFRVGITITLATLLIGVLVGSIAAYYGGVIDNILMRIVDIFLTLPFLMAALILATILVPRFGKSIYPAVIALIGFGWMGYARLIRGDILSIKEREYVLAARAVGARDYRILFRHIVPNAIFPTFVVASMDIGSYVLSFAALAFLGIGVEIGYADWGQLLSFARNWISSLADYWYIVVWPGLALVLFVLAWNLVGDALRDALDPRMRTVRR
ncbi:MAG: ABC transporter permease [Anaerolineae bacterium]